MGTDVVRVASVEEDRDLTVWHVTTEISDDQSVDYLMGVVRDGTSVAQVGFVPAPHVASRPGRSSPSSSGRWPCLGEMPAPKG